MSRVIVFGCEYVKPDGRCCSAAAPGTDEDFRARRRAGQHWFCVMHGGVEVTVGSTDGSADYTEVKDTGERRSFDTGSVRDTQDGKPRIDLIPPSWIRRLGIHLANGAVKYGDSNWQKGQPVSQYYTSGMRHMLAWFEGLEDEDHFAAAAWNTLAAMWTLDEVRAGRLPASLDDRLLYAEAAREAVMDASVPMPEAPAEPEFVPVEYETGVTGLQQCARCKLCCCSRDWKQAGYCQCDRPVQRGS